MKEELTGKLSDIIYYNEESCYAVTVFETDREQFCAVGTMPLPRKGRSYRLTGDWKEHPKYGEQFVFTSCEELAPTTVEGIAALLSSGIIRGVGPSTAAAIVARFGEATLDVIRFSPGRLTEIHGIGEAKAAMIAEGYAEHMEFADTVLELSNYGISTMTAMRLFKAYGSAAPERVKENPYQLIDELHGFGFKKADDIARKMGFDQDSPFRISSGIRFYMSRRAGAGDTYVPKAELLEEVASFLEVTREQVEVCLFDLIMDAQLFAEKLSGEEIVMLYIYHRAEQKVAGKLRLLCSSELDHISANTDHLIRASEKKSGIKLSDRQKQAVVSSLKNGVSVITGGPGTGKTTIINMMLAILESAGIYTALAAPTGRAAKRMTQATGREASTIHRLLEYTYSEDDDSMHFSKNETSPLDFGCIIIDEMSMVDVLLMDGLLAAIKPGTRLILVGDADQLPPVGAGSVLSDIIDSGTIHVVKLTEIFRQAGESLITVNAHLINRGEYPSFNEKDRDFFFLDRAGQKEIADTVIDLCARRLPAFYTNIDPFTDIQVLTPVRKGILGCEELNRALQAVMNPPAPGKAEKRFGERIFREGDKVMQNKNDYTLEWRSVRTMATSTGVFNGDLGVIQRVDNDAGTVSVLFDGERLVIYDYVRLEELETAFAMTVHKSQGSEFPVVIMPMSAFPPMLANRNLLYTAITRAKEGVVLVGRRQALYAMVDNDSTVKRNSGLAARLEAVWDMDFGAEIPR
jgi:exodeoxyribonuclease V alpha subunit